MGEEAPAAHTPTIAIKLLDVHLPAVANAVALARHAAGDIEVAVFFVLPALREREVFLQQPNAALLRPLAADVGVHAAGEEGRASIVIALLGPPFQQSALRFLPARGLICPAARRLGRVARKTYRHAPPQAVEEGGGHAPARPNAGDLGPMLIADTPVDLVRLDQQGAAQARQVPGPVAFAHGVAVIGPHRSPGAIAICEMCANARLEAPGRPLDGDIGERRGLLPMLAEGPTQQRPQQVANPLHQPPCSCGMNRVCSAVGSNFSTSLPGLPSPLRATARKPLPVNCRKRSSASATAFESATSNSCRVSPVRSITIWTAMCTLLLTYQRVAYSPKLALAIARARRCCAHADVKDACSRRRLPTIPAGQPLEWRHALKPRLCRLELGGEPQQGRLLAVAGSKMHAHR